MKATAYAHKISRRSEKPDLGRAGAPPAGDGPWPGAISKPAVLAGMNKIRGLEMEPITLEEAKTYCRISNDVEDALISA
jgi:hypothetical protein